MQSTPKPKNNPMKKYLFAIIPALVLMMGIHPGKAQDGDYFVRYPSLTDDGSRMAFVYQGDIWVKSLNGEGEANRLTIHEGYDQKPRWSPDGERIAFTSDRYGHPDIYLIDQYGNQTQRLTYHSTSDMVSGWYSENEILFTTNRAFAQVEREDEVYTVSLEGETPERLLDAVGNEPARSPNGRFIAFVRGSCRKAREAYKGPANGNIWIYDTERDQYIQITTYEGNDFQPRWAGNNTLYFISSRNGKYNIFHVGVNEDGEKTGEPVADTRAEDMGIRYFDVSANGNKLVYEKGIGIYIQEEGAGEPRKLSMNLPGDYRHTPVQHKTYSKEVSDYALSPNGKNTAFVVRGELFLINNDKDKSRTVRLTDHAYRDFQVDWVNDSTLVFVSDRTGRRELHLLRSSDRENTALYKSLRHETLQLTSTEAPEHDPVVAPNGEQVAFLRGNGQLVVADIDAEAGELSNEKVLKDGWATPSGVTWSPDSKWLAYSLEDLYFNSEVYIHPADDHREPVNVSMHPKGDYAPYWSPDGSKLGFLSERNNGDRDLWFAWLKKEDWQKTQEDWEESEDPEEKNDKNGGDKTEEITIDLENIHERLEQVTALPGNEANLVISEDGQTFYFSTNSRGRKDYEASQDLYSIKWDGTEKKALTENDASPRGLSIDHKSSTLYMLKPGGMLAKLNTKDKALKPISIQAEMDVELEKEMEQLFEDAWSVIQHGFYDPEFHNNDWKELKEKYKPMAMAASTRQDFRDMFNIMLGQLNASHMGLYGDDLAETEDESTGLLGIEAAPHPEGAVIKHVIPNSPADREFSQLQEGEVITSVNGRDIEGSNLYATLINKAEKEIYMEVRDQEGNRRNVTIRPTRSLYQEKYKEWVEERKELTEEYSNGRLGYIHIQGMNWTSFERFERELMASGYGKEGIVIDVRFNGGGWTTDYLMTVLNVRQHAYTIPRGATDDLDENHEKFSEYYPYAERLPQSAWTKPSIALCNQNSYSNAEIFSHAFKNLNHGKLVGTPTFGAVISTGGRRMIDNSYIRLPFRAWYVKQTDKNMEHGPAVPDIIVRNKPDSKAEGKDPQLKKAVDALLKQIDQKE